MNHEVAHIEFESDCSWLDAYLDGELVGCRVAVFDAHLVNCAACREAVDQQRWIDETLRSPEAAELEAARRTALTIAMGRARRHRRRHVIAVATMAAAIAAVAALPLISRPRSEGPGEGFYSVVAEAGHHPEAINRSSPGPSLPFEGIAGRVPRPAATFVSGGDAIIVPVASPSDDVTIVEVFQTVGAQQRLQAIATLTSLSTEPNGG